MRTVALRRAKWWWRVAVAVAETRRWPGGLRLRRWVCGGGPGGPVAVVAERDPEV